MARSDGNKLISLEAGRFFAALGVMLFHYTGVIANFRGVTVFGDIFRPGHVGVPYFFVLSGFIIYHVHRADLGQAGAVGRFVVKRAVRLFPMFLAISVAMLLAFLVSPSMAGQRELTPLGVAADLLLLPHADAILSISWTLRHEMVFYALFALALWFGPKAFWAIGVWIAISMVAGLYALAAGVDTVPWMGSWSVVASTLNLGFGLGMIVAATVNVSSGSRPWPLIGLGGGLLALLCAIEWTFGRSASHDVDILGPFGMIGLLLGAAALISGLVRLEATWTMPAPGFWKAAGGSSYVLYLIHQPLASLALRLLKRLPLSAEAMFVILALVAVATALVIHLTVEKWLLRRLSTLGRRSEPPTVTAEAALALAPAPNAGLSLTTPRPPGQSQR
ncbi:acyltransferase family protein [Caulobacter rhizosphaerae]|jgi:peptidoglycan/LPS O-acetylase OafA/YrhL|uniref:acyltransferase family protein n=1 Tax=Caulobacter rhizosphaerae TaxID=2010972 RepID=UPI0013D1F197|nr:acyltransferase [Caulobacter rhizosphaerae]GGL18859.1 acyltransferase [Caulobacter rhizosphaerae]